MAQAEDVPGFEDLTPSQPSAAPQQAPQADPSPAEQTTADDGSNEQVAGQKEQEETDLESQAPEAETEDSNESEELSQEQPLSKAEERKAQLNREIRDMVSTRNTIRQSVEKQNAEVYQPATEEELVENGYSPEMAAIESMKQEREVEKYNNAIAENQLAIDTQSAKILEEMPMFDPSSKDYKGEIAASAAQILQDNLILDPNTGAVIGSNIDPYTLYSTIHNAYNASAIENQVKGRQATEKMLAEVDSPTSSGPSKSQKDPFMDGFDNPWGK